MNNDERIVNRGCIILEFWEKEMTLKLTGHFNDRFITIQPEKKLIEFDAEELKTLCAKEIYEAYPEIFATLLDAKEYLWFLQYDINDYLVRKPLGKGTRSTFGVTAKGKLFLNEDEGCWTEYCNTDGWEKEDKNIVVKQLHKEVNEFGCNMSKDSCEQLVDWIIEAKTENKIINKPMLQGFNMDFESDEPLPMQVFE